MNVVHIITGLDRGGAEGVMLRLCLASHGKECRHTVISLTGRGELAETFEKGGIAVTSLGMSSAASFLPAIWRLRSILRSVRPDVVQTWMYHADLIGGIATRLAGFRSLVWGIRSTVTAAPVIKSSTRMIIRLCARFSGVLPAKIVVCAHNAAEAHARIGYERDKITVIQNGVDERRFNRVDAIGSEWRASHGLRQDSPVIGLVARFTPQKDHLTLLQALSALIRRGEPYQCLLIGNGIDDDNVELKTWVSSLGLSDHVRLMGPRADLPDVMRSLDLHVMSSQIEGFPNVLAEAMACGTPCVSTDAGDAEYILADLGWLVPKGDAAALADALCEALAEYRDSPDEWQRRRVACEKHIREKFGMQQMVESYTKLWRAVAQEC